MMSTGIGLNFLNLQRFATSVAALKRGDSPLSNGAKLARIRRILGKLWPSEVEWALWGLTRLKVKNALGGPNRVDSDRGFRCRGGGKLRELQII